MAKKNTGSGCLGLIILVAAFSWWMNYTITNTPPQPKADPAQRPDPSPVADNLVAAVREAQHIVGQRLKNPADAKWPGILSGVDLRTHAQKNSDGSYTIKSYVDAMTPLGARKRVWYLARATGSENRWQISDVAVND